jgi:hypothetical protein
MNIRIQVGKEPSLLTGEAGPLLKSERWPTPSGFRSHVCCFRSTSKEIDIYFAENVGHPPKKWVFHVVRHVPSTWGNPKWARVVESHPSAKNALGWGTRLWNVPSGPEPGKTGAGIDCQLRQKGLPWRRLAKWTVALRFFRLAEFCNSRLHSHYFRSF